MKFFITIVIFACAAIGYAIAGGAEIAAAAKSQIGLPYSFVSFFLILKNANYFKIIFRVEEVGLANLGLYISFFKALLLKLFIF